MTAVVALAAMAGALPAGAIARSSTEPAVFGTSQYDTANDVAVFGSFVYVAAQSAGSMDGPNRGQNDAVIRKYSDDGELLWADQFGTQGADWADGIAVDAAGSAYIVGYVSGSLAGSRGAIDAFIRKYNSSGTVQWTRQFGTAQPDFATRVIVDSAGNIYVVGYTYGSLRGTNKGLSDVFIRKYTPKGTVLWTRQFGSASYELAGGVAVAADGSVYMVGDTLGSIKGTHLGSYDAFIRKYNANGTAAWTKQFGTPEYDWASGVGVDASGAVIVAGSTAGALRAGNQGGLDGYVRKYSPSGSPLVTRQFGTSADDRVWGLSVGPNDNYYLAGDTAGALGGPNVGGFDVFVRSYTSGNTRAWDSQHGTAVYDSASGIAATNDALYVVGSTEGALVLSSGQYDAFLMRLDSTGSRVWTDQ